MSWLECGPFGSIGMQRAAAQSLLNQSEKSSICWGAQLTLNCLLGAVEILALSTTWIQPGVWVRDARARRDAVVLADDSLQRERIKEDNTPAAKRR